jgi:uncharacterized protein YaeQ
MMVSCMALGATIYNFDVELADTDRGVYESLALRIPDDVDFRDVTEEIALLAAVQEAEADIAAGRVVPNEEMKRRIGEWTGR